MTLVAVAEVLAFFTLFRGRDVRRFVRAHTYCRVCNVGISAVPMVSTISEMSVASIELVETKSRRQS